MFPFIYNTVPAIKIIARTVATPRNIIIKISLIICFKYYPYYRLYHNKP
jgi:hypothetical protein